MNDDMLVIDVDSHWEPPQAMEFLSDDGDMTDRLRAFIEILAGDVLRDVPKDQWPPLESLVPARFGEFVAATAAPRLGAHDIPGRLQWLDQVGIDYQFLNQGGFTGVEAAITDPDDRRAFIRQTNDRLVDDVADHVDRFSPIVNADLTDLEGAIVELQRCRQRGSRAFHVRAVPPGGISYAHPHFDRLWSAIVDFGMVPYLHIGNTPAYFDAGWANMGVGIDGSAGSPGLMRLSNSARTQTAETLVAALAYGGVFHRHPKLTLLIAELWTGWMPFLIMRLDQNTAADCDERTNQTLGDWPYDLSAGDAVRRNVRVTPLPSLGSDGIPTLQQLPEMFVFSSDYPHREGSATPIDDYQPELTDEIDRETRAAFLGTNIAACFERMGDPLPTLRSAGV